MSATVDRLRKICSKLPEVELTSKTGQHHRLEVRGKTLGYHTVDHHGDGRVALSIKARKGENVGYVESDPVRYFMPPYMGHHGYIGIYLDVKKVDWKEIEALVLEAYRLTAPKALLKLLPPASAAG